MNKDKIDHHYKTFINLFSFFYFITKVYLQVKLFILTKLLIKINTKQLINLNFI